MKIAVITPYLNEPKTWLEKCHHSVSHQTYPVRHFFIGDGLVQDWIDGLDAEHIKLSKTHGNYGDTPRLIGLQALNSLDFDMATFLDADNWFCPNHIETSVKLHIKTQANIITSRRKFYDLSGSILMGYLLHPDSNTFTDMNCMFITKDAFAEMITAFFSIPDHAHSIDDRIIWRGLRKSGISIAHSNSRTVCYRLKNRRNYSLFCDDFYDKEISNQAKRVGTNLFSKAYLYDFEAFSYIDGKIRRAFEC
jgi:hypothetical protein